MDPGSYPFSSYHNGGGTKEQDIQKLAQTINTSIQKISQNVSSMQRMVNQLGTPQDNNELRSQLHQIQNYTQQLVKDTSANVKDLSNIAAPASSSVAEQRQLRMQRERLTDEFTTCLNSFQNTQRMAAQKEKENLQKSKALANAGDPYAGIRQNNQLIEIQDRGRNQQTQMQEELNLQVLQQQEQSIRELETAINDVNQIFKELGTLVHDQGEMVDSIEASVERTEVFVQEGAQQLRQASTYQNKLRKKKLFWAILGALILSAIITFIALELRN